MVALSGVSKGKQETISAYIYRFTKVVVVIKGTDESLKCFKCWIFKKGLRPDNIFWEMLGSKEAYNLKDLLSMDHPYIKYEEKVLADGGN